VWWGGRGALPALVTAFHIPIQGRKSKENSREPAVGLRFPPSSGGGYPASCLNCDKVTITQSFLSLLRYLTGMLTSVVFGVVPDGLARAESGLFLTISFEITKPATMVLKIDWLGGYRTHAGAGTRTYVFALSPASGGLIKDSHSYSD